MQLQKTTPYLDSIIKKSKKVKKQFIFSKKELRNVSNEVIDPLCDEKFKVTKYLIHHYESKVLFLTSPTCYANCRHCFRKNILHVDNLPSYDDIKEASDYIKTTESINEILLSGGDPLVYNNEKIQELLEFFSEENVGRKLLFRVCTRVPIVEPTRIDDELLRILSNYNCRFAVHVNCCDELTTAATESLKKIKEANFEILTQTVLLRGINDSYYELKRLFLQFLELGLTPYYLFQGDPAKGTACFRVPLKTGIKIYKRLLRLKVKIPVFARDLPNGGGKVKIV